MAKNLIQAIMKIKYEQNDGNRRWGIVIKNVLIKTMINYNYI